MSTRALLDKPIHSIIKSLLENTANREDLRHPRLSVGTSKHHFQSQRPTRATGIANGGQCITLLDGLATRVP